MTMISIVLAAIPIEIWNDYIYFKLDIASRWKLLQSMDQLNIVPFSLVDDHWKIHLRFKPMSYWDQDPLEHYVAWANDSHEPIEEPNYLTNLDILRMYLLNIHKDAYDIGGLISTAITSRSDNSDFIKWLIDLYGHQITDMFDLMRTAISHSSISTNLLHLAVQLRRIDVINYLIHNTTIDVLHRNQIGVMPLDIPLWRRDKYIISILFRNERIMHHILVNPPLLYQVIQVTSFESRSQHTMPIRSFKDESDHCDKCMQGCEHCMVCWTRFCCCLKPRHFTNNIFN
eukprot:506095_1